MKVILEMTTPVKGVRSFLGHIITGVLEMISLWPLDLLLNKGSQFVLRGALQEKFTSAPLELINGVLYRMVLRLCIWNKLLM